MQPTISDQKLEVLYVGNLPPSISHKELQALFGLYGEVLSVMLLTDSSTDPPNHFGWVYMGQAEAAVMFLDDAELDGRRLQVQMMGTLFPNEMSVLSNRRKDVFE